MRHDRIAIALLLLSAPALPEEPRARALAEFVRLVHYQTSREDRGRWIGQTSVRELRHPDTGVVVVLLPVTHIGAADYYRSLTPHLRDAEVVLAEGHRGKIGAESIKDEDLPPVALWTRRSHAVLARLLGLVNQGDWEAAVADKRWRLADMGTDEILAAARDIPFPEALKSRVEEWEAIVDGTPTAETRARAKEAAAASIMRNFYEDTPADDSWSDIHRRREEIARRTLAECVASGKLKRIAVLYGSWHMPAFQEQLTRELGFRVEATCWLDCIVFEKPAKPAEEK